VHLEILNQLVKLFMKWYCFRLKANQFFIPLNFINCFKLIAPLIISKLLIILKLIIVTITLISFVKVNFRFNLINFIIGFSFTNDWVELLILSLLLNLKEELQKM